MKVTRIYTGEDNQSHFEDLEVPLNPVRHGRQSDPLPARGVIFRETPAHGRREYHNPEQRQLIITLCGEVEIECGDGSRRRFGPGDVMLADDATGQGHMTREIQGPRHAIFVPLPKEFDISAWRTRQTH
jgi:hypothetical protein